MMNRIYTNEDIMQEIELARLRMREYRKEAEEIIRDYGWSEKDDDFEIQIELEAKRLWEEEDERVMYKSLRRKDFENDDE